MRVPTIRVANPNDPTGYMTINACDVTPAHEIWPEQAEVVEEAALSPGGEGEATIATRVVAKVLALKAGVSLTEWRGLPSAERLRQVMGEEARIDSEVEKQAAYAALGTVSGDAASPDTQDLRIVKGPGGRWFGMRGAQRVTKSCASEAEARAQAEATEDA